MLPLVQRVVPVLEYGPHAVTTPVRDASGIHRQPRKLLLRGTVVTMNDAHDVVERGNVLVVGSKIAAVWADGDAPRDIDASGAEVISAGPGGLIYPGLINLHDHPTYDVLPIAPPPARYTNRYQWNRTRPPEFARLINNASDALIEPTGLNLYVDVLKHAEARSALGGVTTMQNGSNDPALAGGVRDADHANFGRDHVESRVKSVGDSDFPGYASGLRDRMRHGLVDAWLVHLAEGTDAASRDEFARIQQHGVLTSATTILHGTALTADDFAAMAAAGAKLVWSPLSNLLLYGQTASIYDALARGVVVSLGTDWTPSGANTLLDELKVADRALRDPRLLGAFRHRVPALGDDVLLDRTLVDMVTRNPAATLGWPEAGQIVAGRVADLLMIRRPATTPTGRMPTSAYRSLIDATQRDVNLVLVGGKPRAGSLAALQQLNGDDFETVRSGTGKYALAIDVTTRDIPRGRERLATVESNLARALRALGGDSGVFPYLRKHFDGGRYAFADDAAFRDDILVPRYGTVGGRVNLEGIRLHPLLTDDDGHFFAVIAGRISGDARPPFAPYPAYFHFNGAQGNPFARDQFEDRWWGAAG